MWIFCPTISSSLGVQEKWHLLPPLSAQGWVLPMVNSDQLMIELQDATNGGRNASSQLLFLKTSSEGAINQILSLGGGSARGIMQVMNL